MHILYLHQHFAVPSGTTGTRSYEFAKRWVKAGHKVTVISGKYDISGLADNKKFLFEKQIEGIRVIVVGTRYSNKQNFIKRVLSFFTFMFFSIFAAFKAKKVDVIFATSTPLTIGIPAMVLKKIKRAPFVFEVRDQWPEIPIEMGYIKNHILQKMLLKLEEMIYKSAAGIVALSPGMAEGVRSVLGNEKRAMVVAPNSSDVDLFHPEVDSSEIRKEYGWNDKFVILHFGAMGKANGLDFLVNAAEKLKENPEILFVILGDGSERTKIEQMIENNKLENVQLIESKPKSILPKFVSACDVSTVIFADYSILEHNSANKFFDSLSAGKPVLLNYSGWQRKVIEENNAGLGCEQYNLDEYVKKVKQLSSQKEELSEMGKNARKLAGNEFSRDLLSDRVINFLQKVEKNEQ